MCKVSIPSNRVMSSELKSYAKTQQPAHVSIPSNRVMSSEVRNVTLDVGRRKVSIPSNRVMSSEQILFNIIQDFKCLNPLESGHVFRDKGQ